MPRGRAGAGAARAGRLRLVAEHRHAARHIAHLGVQQHGRQQHRGHRHRARQQRLLVPGRRRRQCPDLGRAVCVPGQHGGQAAGWRRRARRRPAGGVPPRWRRHQPDVDRDQRHRRLRRQLDGAVQRQCAAGSGPDRRRPAAADGHRAAHRQHRDGTRLRAAARPLQHGLLRVDGRHACDAGFGRHQRPDRPERQQQRRDRGLRDGAGRHRRRLHLAARRAGDRARAVQRPPHHHRQPHHCHAQCQRRRAAVQRDRGDGLHLQQLQAAGHRDARRGEQRPGARDRHHRPGPLRPGQLQRRKPGRHRGSVALHGPCRAVGHQRRRTAPDQPAGDPGQQRRHQRRHGGGQCDPEHPGRYLECGHRPHLRLGLGHAAEQHRRWPARRQHPPGLHVRHRARQLRGRGGAPWTR